FLAVASGRYEWIGRIVRAAVRQPRVGQIGLTGRLDRWAAHPVWGLIILAAVLGLVFWLTFTIGSPLQQWLDENAVAPLAGWAGDHLAWAPFWLRGMVVDGIIGGVGSVLTFLPILVIFFAAFALLEDVGYMARAAYVMDNVMHVMGLHGKSFLPLFLGFGCNVPAVMGTRVIDSPTARLLTILIAPLVPCTARMAVVAFIAPAFFGRNATLVTWGMVLLSLAALVGSGALLNKVLFKGQRSAFIMEMPLYHIPNLRTIGLLVWQRSISFVKKAGTAILAMSLLVWALSYLPNGDLNTSLLAQLGHFLEPVGRWMGFDWRLTVALITSFPAKENIIATLGVLFANSPDSGLAATLASTFSTATALSFLVVTMLFIPCMATVAVTKQETNSWKWTLISIFLMLGLSIAGGTLVYHLAMWTGV
ncbi:MAG TPA: ferrous iron transport protein B, partial [Anaerolineaceae bacterium]|nr:ferrous iron transport protein B [Anaerolineaceae bacterium]